MCLIAGLLNIAAVYSGCLQAATPVAYYVLDADFSLQQATVVSLEDGNMVSAGNTQLYLDSGETGIIPVADLMQGTRISASGAFTLGNSVNGTDLPNPESFAGTRFSIPHKTGSHHYLLLSPDTTAQVTIVSDGDTSDISLIAGQVYTREMGSNNRRSQAGVITSDVPILVAHKGYDDNDARYAYPVPPAAAEVWGFRSKRILVGAAGTSANVDLYASSGDSKDKLIDQYKYKDIGVGDNDSEGRGDAVHVISDQPVSAVQFDDGDGREATAFFSSDYLATHFALPVDTRYVAVLCTQTNTVITLYEDGYNPDQRPCSAGGLTPGKVYFGSSSDGVHMRTGARIEASRPVYLIYEDAATDDEKNLLGFNLWGPSITIVNPGEQKHLETRNVSLQIKATGSEGLPLTYSAAGLPPGLAIDADSGRVSGQVARGAAGSYTTMITVGDGIAVASVEIQWVITGGNIGIETIIHAGDYWKYLDDGSDQGTLWRESGADDSAWPEGGSQFGYGEGDETTVVDFGGDSRNKHITTYFRHEFILQDTSLVTELALRLMRDDGAVVYLNGHEIIRSNMPNGTIDYLDEAKDRMKKTNHRDVNKNENIFLDYSIDPAWLIDGPNVLAVEVHLHDDKSEDMSFDLELSAAIDLVEDVIPPLSTSLELVSFAGSPGKTFITGAAGAAEAFSRISIATASGETVAVVANADGSFSATLDSDKDENVSITLADRHGNEGETVNVTAVGSTAGSFDVSPQGAGTYTIPLTIPPAITGMQPDLSLAYNSQAGDGLLGPGWSLQGLSAISRCGTTRAQDGFIDGVDFDANDRFCLDGQRLIEVKGPYGGNATEYRTEIDSFSKIVSYTETGTSGVAYFLAWTRSGQILEYGVTADSRIEASNRSDAAVLICAVNRIGDTVGNYITMAYTERTSGEYYPLRIDYSGNDNAGVTPLASVSFSYSSRPGTKGYLAGSSVESTRVVSQITTRVGSDVVRTYHLRYKTGRATGRKRLVSVKECSPGACLPATTFTWQDTPGVDFDALATSSHAGSGWHTYASLADVNGDGLTDWVYSGSASVIVRLSNGDGTFGSTRETAHAGSGWHTYASLVDVNGDGLADWVYSGSASVIVRLSNGDGTFGSSRETAHAGAGWHTYASLADVNGDGLADWIYSGSASVIVRLSNGDGSFGSTRETAHAGAGRHTYASLADVNGDGLADWIYSDSASGIVRLSNGDGTFGSSREAAYAGAGWY
ncbi:MAG: FG-GAP-like repeat-containing protein, partial [Gammaproteobacteria bacterium]